MIPSVPKPRLAFSLLTRQTRYCWALLRRDIRTRLSHCWANSLVNVCDAALKGIADQSRGVLTEMRVARDLHTISCTPHHSFARAEQEDAGLAHVLTNANLCFVREYRSAAGTSKELLGFSDHEVHGVHVFLRCDTRASLHDCCSASVMLDSRAMQLRLDLETSLLSLLRRIPNQVAWKHCLRVNQRLFSVFKSSAGGSVAGSSSLVATVVSGSSVFLIRTHFDKELRVLCRGSETDSSATMRDFTLPKGLAFGLVSCLWFELPTTLRTEVRTGVLWVSTGTHPCDAPIQAG